MSLSPKIFLILVLFTFFSILVFPGYEVFISDQEIYLPLAYHHVDKDLFSQDLILKFDVLQYSLFDELIAFLLGFTSNISIILFFVYMLTRFIYFYALFKLALYFTKDEKFSILSLLLFVPTISVYGTQIFDTLLIPRVIGFSLGLLSLAYFFERRYFTSTILLSLHYLIHPLTSFFFMAFFYANLLFNFEKKKFFNKELLLPGLIPIITFFFTAIMNGPGLGFFNIIDDSWNSIILFRWSSFFVSGWDYKLFLVLFTSIIVFLIGLDSYRDRVKKIPLVVLLLLPLFMFMISFFAADLLKLHFIAQLQIYRSLFFIKIFGALLFFRMAYLHIKRNSRDIFYNFFMLGTVFSYFVNEDFIYPFFYTFLYLWINRRYKARLTRMIPIFKHESVSIILFIPIFFLFFIVVRNFPSFSLFLLLVVFSAATTFTALAYFKKNFPFTTLHVSIFFLVIIIISIPSFSIYSSYYKDKELVASCEWIKENTAKDSVFITFPDKLSRPIRLLCHRSVFASGREGSSSLFDRSFAFEWKKRMEIHSAVYANISSIKSLTSDYRIDYVFSKGPLMLDYPLVYNNSIYHIYNLK